MSRVDGWSPQRRGGMVESEVLMLERGLRAGERAIELRRREASGGRGRREASGSGSADGSVSVAGARID